ncbi:MAG TPA: hypothetical protein PKA25_02295 [Bradyrhizobium sp.]|nr:hypothetical protein [Bradyrhizobium sp.]
MDDHKLSVVFETAKLAFAEAVDWCVVSGLNDVSISDGIRSYTIAEFSEATALREMAETILARTSTNFLLSKAISAHPKPPGKSLKTKALPGWGTV